REDPVEHMTGRSIVAILHQDPFLIEFMLNDIAKIFKRIIEWNSADIKTLKEDIALFQYEFAHDMTFTRGSAAISEYFEMAFYEYHGFKLSYNDEKMVNLEALTSSLKEFVQNYDSMIRLDKI